MSDKKTIFVAFAMKDERSRDFLKGQSLNTKSPFEYIDMSVKDAYDKEWSLRDLCGWARSGVSAGTPDVVVGT
ncbi:hypothetical protein [Marivita sp.]|jgi:hypothetical protein|uniref:hypothetical protein n=1 Tax=Marivita sp. TaxID=2003365 RepID=UPI003F6BDDC9